MQIHLTDLNPYLTKTSQATSTKRQDFGAQGCDPSNSPRLPFACWQLGQARGAGLKAALGHRAEPDSSHDGPLEGIRALLLLPHAERG